MARKKSGDSGAQSEVARASETVPESAKSNSIEGSSLTLRETPEARHARIAEAAYRKAGNRGFAPGGELDDWLAAEREVSAEEQTAAPSAAS